MIEEQQDNKNEISFQKSLSSIMDETSEDDPIFGPFIQYFKNIHQLFIGFLNSAIKSHQIRSFRLNPTQEYCLKLIQVPNSKMFTILEVIEIIREIDDILLNKYHEHEKQLILKVKQMEKHFQNKEHEHTSVAKIDSLNLEVQEWHHRVLTNVKNVTEIRMFKSEEGVNIGYNDQMLPMLAETSVENKQGEFLLKQLRTVDIECILDDSKKIINKMLENFQIQTLQSRIKLFKSFLLEEIEQIISEIEDYVENDQQFLNFLLSIIICKMIFEVIRNAKISQENIDCMTEYLNSLKESIVNLQSYYQMVELDCEQIMQDSDTQLKEIRLLDFSKNQFEKFQKIKDDVCGIISKALAIEAKIQSIPKEVFKIITNKLQLYQDLSIYPQGILNLLIRLYNYFFRGQRQLLKARIQYQQVTDDIRNSLDKESLLSTKIYDQIVRIQAKISKLSSTYSGIQDTIRYCPSSGIIHTKVDKFVDKTNFLILHYIGMIEIMKGMKEEVYNLEREEIKPEELLMREKSKQIKNTIFLPDIILPQEEMLSKLLIQKPIFENDVNHTVKLIFSTKMEEIEIANNRLDLPSNYKVELKQIPGKSVISRYQNNKDTTNSNVLQSAMQKSQNQNSQQMKQPIEKQRTIFSTQYIGNQTKKSKFKPQ